MVPLERANVALKYVVLVPLIAVLAILAGIGMAYSDWLLVFPSILIVYLILEMLRQPPAPTPLSSLTIAPDHVGVAGVRVPMKEVRRVERLEANGAHEIVLRTKHETVTVARTAERAQARYIADRLEEAYRAFLRRG